MSIGEFSLWGCRKWTPSLGWNLPFLRLLVNFHISINLVDKHRRAQVSETAAHEPQTKAEHCHVTEIERGLNQIRRFKIAKNYLEKSVHARFEKEIVNWIEIHVAGRGGSREKRRPVPAVVLGVQQEVCTDNGHADRHCTQNSKNFQKVLRKYLSSWILFQVCQISKRFLIG